MRFMTDANIQFICLLLIGSRDLYTITPYKALWN